FERWASLLRDWRGRDGRPRMGHFGSSQRARYAESDDLSGRGEGFNRQRDSAWSMGFNRSGICRRTWTRGAERELSDSTENRQSRRDFHGGGFVVGVGVSPATGTWYQA